jgi:hypothetical protein
MCIKQTKMYLYRDNLVVGSGIHCVSFIEYIYVICDKTNFQTIVKSQLMLWSWLVRCMLVCMHPGHMLCLSDSISDDKDSLTRSSLSLKQTCESWCRTACLDATFEQSCNALFVKYRGGRILEYDRLFKYSVFRTRFNWFFFHKIKFLRSIRFSLIWPDVISLLTISLMKLFQITWLLTWQLCWSN